MSLPNVEAALFRLRPLTWIGFALFCLSFWARLHGLDASYDFFDEGIILTNANFIRLGLAPYRDFYTNYGPGTFLLVIAIWKVVGISWLALGLRLLSLSTHLALSLLSGRLAGRVNGRRFSWLACGLVSLWTMSLGLSPFAWTIGLALGLGFLELWLGGLPEPTRVRAAVAGVCFGALGCVRHDLFVYLTVVLGCVWAVTTLFVRHLGLAPVPWRRLRWLALGALTVLALVWTPFLIRAGLPRVVDDLFLSQVRYVMPARVLPLPSLLARNGLGRMAFWGNKFEGAIALTFAGPALAVLLLGLRAVLGIRSSGPTIICVGSLAVAVMPQMLGRTDVVHALYTVAPALILGSALLEAFLRPYVPCCFLKTGLIVGLVTAYCAANWHMVWPPSPAWPTYTHRSTYTLDAPRPGFYEPNPYIADARAAVFDFIARNSSPQDAIFVGNLRHDRVYVNEPDLYFLANRRPGTRYTQFEPNVVTREDVQREMIASLERKRVRVLVLSNRADWYEPQLGIMPGSTVFDEYIAAHFRVAERHPPYVLYARND